MSVLVVQVDGHTPHRRHNRSLLPLVFDRRVVVSRCHWLSFVAAGLLVPLGVLVAAYHVPPRRVPPLPPMEVVLTRPTSLQAIAPPPEPPRAEPERPKPKAPSPARPRTEAPDPNVRARASKVIAMAPDAPSPPAVAGDAIVTGDSDRYAGGATVSSGTSEKAVDDVPSAIQQPPQTPPVDVVAVTRAYLGRIRELLVREKRYPLAAQRTGIEGTVVVFFLIDAEGRFGQVRIVSSSGSDLLDTAAVGTVSELSGKVERPRDTGDLALPLKTALRFEIPR